MVLADKCDIGLRPSLAHSQYTGDLRMCKAVIQQLQYVPVGLSVIPHRAQIMNRRQATKDLWLQVAGF